MKHLSGMDATFLHVETPETPMHVGGLSLLELPSQDVGDYWEALKSHIASRMHLAPVFTRKLALMPFELADPVWVDDPDVDLDYHVRRVVLPRPGTREQLEALVGRLHSSLLDRSRPLWECYLIEGLADGQLGFYTKAHHAAMDGAAGAVLANAILDVGAVPRSVKAPRVRRVDSGEPLGVAELAGAALKNTAVQYLKLVKLVPAVATMAVKAVRDQATSGPTKDAQPKGAPRPRLGPKTLFNVSITNQRVFAARSLPLADAKAIAKRMEVTLNDVVMTLCSGALRRYLDEREALPAKALIAGVPVSLREAGNTEMNNQATAMVVSLHTDLADPLERLEAIHASAVAAKAATGAMKGVIPMDYPSFGAPWLMTGMVSMLARTKLVNALPPVVNLVISNVPGPQAPLYLAGARLLTNYPVSIPAHGMALNLTVQSYNGALDFGLTACRKAVPDLDDIADHLVDELATLKALVESIAIPAASPIPAPILKSTPKSTQKPTPRRKAR